MTFSASARLELPERTSRFQRQVWPTGWLQTMQRSAKTTQRLVHRSRVLSVQEFRAGYHGVTKRGEMYQIGVSFALENTDVYSEPLPSVEGNRIYQIRMALAQYQGWPPVMGWSLKWSLPAGWVYTDGLGSVTHEEFISNPVVVTRYMRSPANPAPAGFRITVIGKYA